MEKQGNYFDLILNETICVITKSLVDSNDYYYY